MIKKTKVLLGDEARAALKRGVDQIYEPVSRTIGAKGRNSVFDGGGAQVTNDGVTICSVINPEDPFEYLGADMIKQASEKTNEEAGDGTTTSVVFAHAIIEEGLGQLAMGVNPADVKRSLEEAKDIAIRALKEMSKPIDTEEDLFNIANISVENEDIAKTVSTAVRESGKTGMVNVEHGNGYDIEKEQVKGYFWDKGYVSPYMITNDRGEAVLEDVSIILTDKHINLNNEIVGALDELIKSGRRNILLVADNVEGELLNTLILNKAKGIATVVAVKRPSTIEELEDLAILTGATAITKDKGIKKIEGYHAGKATKVIVKRDKTTIIGTDSEALAQRVKDLQTEMEENSTPLLEERLAKLSTGIIILRVGAKTEAERIYLKRKIDDAVGACKAAVEEGVVAGGGVTLREIAKLIPYLPFANACRRPYKKILENAGITDNGEDINYDVKTMEKVDDMIAHGIIDPTKVTRCVIENAVSLAKTFLTIESVIVEAPKESEQKVQD